MKPRLTIKRLRNEAAAFAAPKSGHAEPDLYGVTDGKTIGTYLERKFQGALGAKYAYEQGSSARGIDFPSLNVDMKVTSVRQPQSSSPFKSARQKIFGLGYSLLVFAYRKEDDHAGRTGVLNIIHSIFIDSSRTSDYQTTRGIRDIIKREGNVEDIVAYMNDRNLPIDDFEAEKLAEELLHNPPKIGYLTISNALQWRLQYQRAIENAGVVGGITQVT